MIKFTNKPGFLHLKRLLYLRTYVVFLPNTYVIFHEEFYFLGLDQDPDPDPHWFGSLDPDPH